MKLFVGGAFIVTVAVVGAGIVKAQEGRVAAGGDEVPASANRNPAFEEMWNRRRATGMQPVGMHPDGTPRGLAAVEDLERQSTDDTLAIPVYDDAGQVTDYLLAYAGFVPVAEWNEPTTRAAAVELNEQRRPQA